MDSAPNLTTVLALLALLLLLGAAEGIVHRRNLRRVPLRIHVNGTRGKSSVTRLIAGGLRAGGLVTCAKTTGTDARVILPDGSEYPVFRPSGPNIIEQVRVVATARELGAQALVIECMAVQPLLQGLSELQLVRSTHGVITNARLDHLDVMGPGEEDVARALAGSTPVRGRLFTAEHRHLGVLRASAADRRSEIVVLQEAEEAVGPEAMRGFSYLEHEQNVALALRVCESLGVERDIALRGMWAMGPDPGALTVHEVDFFGRRLVFANGFAANDPESTERIWRRVVELFPDVERRIAIFNCRVDRPDRSRQLGEACVAWPPADTYVLMGTGTYILGRAAVRRGIDAGRLLIAEEQRADDVFETIVERAGRSALVMGMGNVHGGGGELARLFRNRGMRKELT